MKLQHQLRLTKEDTFTSFIMFNSFKQSQKLSNSSLFTDEKESIWDDWQEKIRDKLEINVDHFDNDKVILVYIHSWISKDAVKVILVRRQRDSLNSYSMIDNLLNELSQLYDDSDKETNFRRKYANLIQEKSKFSDFYSIFQRLFFYLEYHEKQLIINLWDKIVYHLHAAWSSQLIQSESFNEIRSYLIHLNMRHDTIIFSNQLNTSISIFWISSNTKHSSWLRSTLISSAAHSKISKMLKHSVSFFQKESFLIQNIDIISFQALVKRKKKNQTEIFAMFIEDINREIIYNTQCKLDVINVFSINEMTQNLEDIKVKLLSKYQNFLDVFDWA